LFGIVFRMVEIVAAELRADITDSGTNLPAEWCTPFGQVHHVVSDCRPKRNWAVL